jgi:uncharacterized protein YdeI (YjbR/CyaY-like superfamily)
MTVPGQAVIDHAKATGAWLAGTDIPPDLRAALDADTAANAHFRAFPPSSRRLILDWIAGAKRQQTRDRRISATVALAAPEPPRQSSSALGRHAH